MARPLRIEFPGALYHVTARGNARADIYLTDGDRATFLAVLAQALDRFGWRCHAWCLMTNHYHLLVETPAADLSRGMRHLNGVYTQSFNRAHRRVGHVLQGRYKAILVEREAHLLELCRYVVRNPVAAGLVGRAADWRWSSYGATAYARRADGLTTTDWILGRFGGDAAAARRRYRAFVARDGEDYRPWDALRGGAVLGTEAFAAHVVERRGRPAGRDGEVPRAQRHVLRPALAALRTGARDRGVWMTSAYRDHGYTMTEIAAAAGLHYSSVSKIIKAHEANPNSQFKT